MKIRIVKSMTSLLVRGSFFMLFKSINESIKRNISLIIIFIFNCLPIKKNKIFFYSYYGSQYGCNPKYITEYILKNCPDGKYQLVWAFNNLTEKRNLSGVKQVKTMTLKYFYELCTSKIIITNFRTTELFRKRKNQFYIQTWHSSLRLKQIEKDAEEILPINYVEMAKKDSKKIDLLLSGCDYSTKIFKRSFWYNGEILERGTPRNDYLFHMNTERKNEILNSLNVHGNYKVVLYAPTFRKNGSLETYNLNYEMVLNQLKYKFGGDWVFLVKYHPHMISTSRKESHIVKDVTNYDDIQELLNISDVLISDYSSLIFDFSITKRPCFLYVPDLFEYLLQDRRLYFNLHELPFNNATSNEMMLEKIKDFDLGEYQRKLNIFLSIVGSFEQGKACQSLVNRIEEICFNKRREKITYETV